MVCPLVRFIRQCRWHSGSRVLPAFDQFFLVAVPVACASTLWEAHVRSDIKDAQTFSDCSSDESDRLLPATKIRQLERDGYLVLDGGSLDAATLAEARRNAHTLMKDGALIPSSNDADVRQDLLCWIRETRLDEGRISFEGVTNAECSSPGQGLLHCVRLLRGIASSLEKHGYKRAAKLRVPRQLQLGYYPGDGTSNYARHLDACIDSVFDIGLLAWLRVSDYRERSVTAILYLNDPHWGDADLSPDLQGGQLRIFKSSVASGDAYVDVAPRGGTLVLFDSRTVEHQVMPTSQGRFALTLWISGEQTGPNTT